MKSHQIYQQSPKRTNEMLKFLGSHLIVGVLTVALFLFAFMYFNLGNLRLLVEKNDLEFVVYPLLLVFFSITFGSTAMGVGIMSIQKEKNDGGGTKINYFTTINFAYAKSGSKKKLNQ